MTKQVLRTKARDLLTELWLKRGEIWEAPPSGDTFFPVRTEHIIRHVLQAQLDEPEELPREKNGSDVAGLVDRSNNIIRVAQKYPQEWRRFTAAHEIGHWVLHPRMVLHRDRPLAGHERSNTARSSREVEADIFASELLMPKRALTKLFETNFGGAVNLSRPGLLQWLATNSGKSEIALSADLRQRSLAVASATSANPGATLVPLAKRFGVSPTAMAIQLEEMELVS